MFALKHSGQLHHSCWVQSLEAVAFCHVDGTSSYLSLQCFCALPAYPAPAAMPFPGWWCSPRDSFTGGGGVGLGHCCSWPCPGLVSHRHTGCGLLAALLAPLIFPWFGKRHCALHWRAPLPFVPAVEMLTSESYVQCDTSSKLKCDSFEILLNQE